MIFRLVHDQARARAIRAIDEAPDGWIVRISEPTRSLDQSAKFHAMCGDFERSGIEWAGKRRSKDEWKVILVSGFSASVGHNPELVQGFEGETVALRESTASMVKRRMSDLIEYAAAIGSELDVRWSDAKDG